MDKPQSLDNIFTKKMFRIPDYQRGYAWQTGQLENFWEDLINLSGDRSHYTGVLTLKEIKNSDIGNEDDEHWLVDDHSYKVYYVVDGQQRLTTFVIFLQAFIDFLRQRKENTNKEIRDIYITSSLNLEEVASKYLFRVRPSDLYRTYKFGYTVDNPSYKYLKHEIFGESGEGSGEKTFYTLNLKKAYSYFYKNFEALYGENSEVGSKKLQEIYKKLTQKFLFNEYVIKDEFDVFVAFETMNNRGKKLSDLELLKNRLIYLTTLYTDEDLDVAERRNLRDSINDAWKEVYHQLGRNSKRPLNDDDFLKAHWIMYFKYSRQREREHIKFLLDEQFSPQRVYASPTIESESDFDSPEEQHTEFERADADVDTDNEDINNEDTSVKKDFLKPIEIKDYVDSLKDSAVHWFNSHYPNLATDLESNEIGAINRLNRIGMGYFHPLVMSFFKNEKTPAKRVEFLDAVERFSFIVFWLGQVRGDYRNSEFFNAAREFDKGELNLEDIKNKLNASAEFCFIQDGVLNSKYFYDHLYKKFNNGSKNGFYGWPGRKYFLYEYELRLFSQSRQPKVSWEDLLKNPRDKVSIEHIFPQTPTEDWKSEFSDIPEEKYSYYSGSLGNLLLLSKSINSALQNDSFDDKKKPKYNDAGEKIRNGYSDGSHSEIEVAKYPKWGPEEIKERGLHLLAFMEERWDFKFESDEAKEKLLFLNIEE